MNRPLFIAVSSLPFAAVGLSAISSELFDYSDIWRGYPLAIAGTLLGLCNFYAGVIKPRLYKIMFGSMIGFRHSSPLPFLATILISISVIYGFGAIGTALISLIGLCVDLGGPHWMAFYLRNDQEFWKHT